MPWEAKPKVIALNTTDRRIADRMLDDMAKQRHLEHQGYSAPREFVEASQKPLDDLLDTF